MALGTVVCARTGKDCEISDTVPIAWFLPVTACWSVRAGAGCVVQVSENVAAPTFAHVITRASNLVLEIVCNETE